MEAYTPSFVIDEILPERAQKLVNLQNAILANPEVLSRALMRHVSVLGPDLTDLIIDMEDELNQQPVDEKKVKEALGLIEAVDIDEIFPFIEFDQPTEEAMDSDTAFNKMLEDWRKDPRTKENNRYTQRVRISRLTYFMGRVSANDLEPSNG